MNERLAFLRAIRANPDDDTARLVFADWLDEHDDPLGAFIRVQLELEPIRYRIDNPRAMELHKREDELLRAHNDDWIPTNELFTNPSDFGPVFRRGLPDYACLSLDTFLKNGEAIFAAYPTLREVALYGVANRCWELTMSPLLANLETLEIADWPTEDDAISLGVSPHLPRISRFKLWVGEEMPFLHELVKQACVNWPRDIELVQVWSHSMYVPRRVARELIDKVDHIAHEANTRLARNAVRVTRPFERLFPLNGDLGFQLIAGHLPDGKPALAAGGIHHWFLTVFNEEGYCQNVDSRLNDVRFPPGGFSPEHWMVLDTEFREWVDDELRLKPSLIWVREFDHTDVAVSLWSDSLCERIANSSPHAPTSATESECDWRNRGGEARGWLERRNFVIEWGPKYQADWRGKIHSS